MKETNPSENANQTTPPAVHATTAETGDAAERTFTQEEVNRIVTDRLARARAKEETPVSAREQALTRREAQLACQEFTLQEDIPQALLTVLDTADFSHFKTEAQALLTAFPVLSPGRAHAELSTALPHEKDAGDFSVDAVAQAFKPKR